MHDTTAPNNALGMMIHTHSLLWPWQDLACALDADDLHCSRSPIAQIRNCSRTITTHHTSTHHELACVEAPPALSHLRTLDAGDLHCSKASTRIWAQQQLLTEGHAARHHCAGQHGPNPPNLKGVVHLEVGGRAGTA